MMMSKHARSIYIKASLVLGAFLVGYLCIVLWWLLYPAIMFTATGPITVEASTHRHKTYHPGGPVLYTYDELCVDKARDIAVQRWVVNDETGKRLALLLYSFNSEDVTPGCYYDLTNSVPLPPEVSPGTYHIEVWITYQANAVRTVTNKFSTPQFEVIPPEETSP